MHVDLVLLRKTERKIANCLRVSKVWMRFNQMLGYVVLLLNWNDTRLTKNVFMLIVFLF